MGMRYDITILADRRYLHPRDDNPYIANVLLEDQLVAEALEAEGLRVTRMSWDDATFDWSSTRFAMFRAVWDYFDRYEEFKCWFKEASQLTQFINSKELIDWNIDKHYLKDLNANGIHIPKTLFVEEGTKTDLHQSLAKARTTLGFTGDSFVLKPCIAGGARHTYKFHLSEWELHDPVFRQLIAKEAMMLQEYQENIVLEGEVSLMLFHGTYTHAILKKAKPGDFRVQDDYGGTVEVYHPTAEEIDFAEKIFKACPEMPFYGRADIFKDNQGYLALAELEIFEPELWFRFHPEAANIMAKSIKANLFT